MNYELIRYHNHQRAIPLIIHIPHASDFIPPQVMDQFVLTPAELAEEHRKMVDHHVDKLMEMAQAWGATLFVNKVSRLVMDPERFLDADQESMEAHGLGVVYLKTEDGRPLRRLDFSEEDRQAVIDRYYHPYHEALNDLVDEFLERFGCCYILDAHSYPAEPNGYEDATLARPDYCIGFEDYHAPEVWLQWWREWGAAQVMPVGQGLKLHVTRTGPDGEESKVYNDWGPRVEKVRFNVPLSGSLVPGRHYLTDPQVKSMMIEVKRSVYMDEATGEMKDRTYASMIDPIYHFLDFATSDMADAFYPQETGISPAQARRLVHARLVERHEPGKWLGECCIKGVVSGEQAGLRGQALWGRLDGGPRFEPANCWAVKRATLPGVIMSGNVVMVDKESGKVVYAGSTYDEG